MFVVATNILIYAADSPEHQKCRDLVESWRYQSTPWHVTWGIIYEFLRVSTHPNVFRMSFTLKNSWGFIKAILASPSIAPLMPTERHQIVSSEVFKEIPDIRGNLIFDTHTAILMREHGIKTIYTRDTDFNRFPFIDVVNPV
jgi:toxin-antitoxin system PIN domain toxin